MYGGVLGIKCNQSHRLPAALLWGVWYPRPNQHKCRRLSLRCERICPCRYSKARRNCSKNNFCRILSVVSSRNNRFTLITDATEDCLNKGDFDHVLHDDINPYPTDSIAPNGYDHGHGSDGRDAPFEHPCLELKRILSSGTFYYSVNFDLTNRLQDRYECSLLRKVCTKFQ